MTAVHDYEHEVHQLVASLSPRQVAGLLEGEHFWQTKSYNGLLPYLRMADGPHGVRAQSESTDHLGLGASAVATCFPTTSSLAQTWSPELANQVGAAIAQEAAELGVNMLLAPGVNLKRTPLCGRNFEYYSEDPHLVIRLAGAFIKGVQSKGVGACLKHFALNNQETERMTVNAVVDQTTLDQLYLAVFKKIVEASRPAAVMTSYNLVNGKRAEANAELIGFLREFHHGLVLTDWGATQNLAWALKAGTDLEMPGGHGEGIAEIQKAMQRDKTIFDAAQEAAKRIVATASTYPLCSNNLGAVSPAIKRTNEALAMHAAKQAIVLLKNSKGLLPLDGRASIGLIGKAAQITPFQGRGSSRVRVANKISLLETLKGRFCGVGYAQGWEQSDLVAPVALAGGLNPPSPQSSAHQSQLASEAVALAQGVTYPIVCLEPDWLADIEGRDRASLQLPTAEIELAKAVIQVNPNTILIVFGGGAVDLSELQEASAIIYAGLAGEGVDEALTSILLGESEPGGRLAETWLANIPQDLVPQFGQRNVHYKDGVQIGYRRYLREPQNIVYPFGYGLSYSQFVLNNLVVQEGENWRQAIVTVTNTGNRRGMTVVQLYAKFVREGNYSDKILLGFQKTTLDPGASRRLVIPFGTKMLETATQHLQTDDVAAVQATIVAGFDCQDECLEVEYRTNNKVASSNDFVLVRSSQSNNINTTGYLTPTTTLRQAQSWRLGRLVWRHIIEKQWLQAYKAQDIDKVIELEIMADLPFYAWSRMSGGKYSPKLAKAAMRFIRGNLILGACGLVWHGIIKRKNANQK